MSDEYMEVETPNSEPDQVNEKKQFNIKIFLIIIFIWLSILTVGFGFLLYRSFNTCCCDDDSLSEDYLPQVPVWRENIYEQIKKPNIYIYPEQESKVHVYLTAENMLTTWPKANMVDENMYTWSVTAEPNGTLYQDNYEYSYLFWEAETIEPYNFEKGFCVKGSETGEFLRSTLSQMGLTPKEYNEFIVFWLPQMEQNEYNLISFVGLDSNDEYNTTYPLTVVDENGNEPNMLRVNMIWKASDYTEIEPQTFTTFDRTGFTVVEWGGREVK